MDIKEQKNAGVMIPKALLSKNLIKDFHQSTSANANSNADAELSFFQQLIQNKQSKQKKTASISTTNEHTQKSAEIDKRWNDCLHLLREDFRQRLAEVQQLNPGRKHKIYKHLCELASLPQTSDLNSFLYCEPESKECEGLELFIWEIAIFQLFQLLLLKRWVDLKNLDQNSFLQCSQKMNWQIASYLKSKLQRGMLQSNQWHFLKVNIYTWFKPSPNVWKKLLQSINDLNLANKEANYLTNILEQIDNKKPIRKLGFHTNFRINQLSWELLRLNSMQSYFNRPTLIPNTVNENRTLIFGLCNGNSLIAVDYEKLNLSHKDLCSFARNEFELYISEIALLWSIGGGRIPSINIQLKEKIATQEHLRTTVSKHPRQKTSIEANEILFFSDDYNSQNELEDVSDLLQNKLRENGQLLFSSNTYWLTDKSDESKNLRVSCLKNSSLKLIIDLSRVNTGENAISIPKFFYVFKKNSSKEIRDSNRSTILKLRGNIFQANELEQLWDSIINLLNKDCVPGEVLSQNIGNLKIELMSAASTQSSLNAGPWTSLAEPSFYEISNTLKRYPYKLSTQGTLLSPHENSIKSVNALPRSLCIFEIPGKALIASHNPNEMPKLNKEDESKLRKYLFIPDKNVKENIPFFAAMINSSPIQFWYRLEWEQNITNSSQKSILKQSDRLLKLMPTARIFPYGSVFSIAETEIEYIEAEEIQTRVLAYLHQSELSIKDAINLQKDISNIEHSIQHHLKTFSEYASFLYEDVHIDRWHIPREAPEISPKMALLALAHLQQAPLKHHPSIRIANLKPATDFRITEVKHRRGASNIDEMILYSGTDAMLRIQGPSILIQIANSLIKQKSGQNWLELAQNIYFPLDIALMQNQIDEFIKLTKTEIQKARKLASLTDFIFCKLFDLQAYDANSGHAHIIRTHLNPNEYTLSLQEKIEKSKRASISLLKNSVDPKAHRQQP